MSEWETHMSELIVAVPAAAAVIFVVTLFLRHLREERASRDAAQTKFLDSMNRLSEPLTQLITEVRLLREQQLIIKKKVS